METENYEQSSEQDDPEVIEVPDELEVAPVLIEDPVPKVTSPPPGLLVNTISLCLLFHGKKYLICLKFGLYMCGLSSIIED